MKPSQNIIPKKLYDSCLMKGKVVPMLNYNYYQSLTLIFMHTYEGCLNTGNFIDTL